MRAINFLAGKESQGGQVNSAAEIYTGGSGLMPNSGEK